MDVRRDPGAGVADMRRAAPGSRREDMAIAALVMMPFTLTLVVLAQLDDAAAGLLLQRALRWSLTVVAGTFWNAGWRARPLSGVER